MNIQKLILPAAMSFAGLVSFGAQAATKAGIEIVNTATLNYTVNNVAQTEVKAEKKLQVDVKIDFNLARTNIAAPNASTEIDVAGSKYYVMGKFDLANTTNAPTTFTLKATNGDGTEALGFTGTDYTSLTDTKDPVNSTFKLYSSAAGASAPATELTGNISLNEDGNASNTTALVWVLIPTSEIKGVDKDVFAVQLEAKASEVTVVGEDDSVLVVNDNGKADTDAVQFVFADDAKADGSLEDGAKNKGDAIETALDALFLTFPNFRALMRYNNSTSYGIGVWLLSQRFNGEFTIRGNWPEDDPPITRSQTLALQEGLVALGYNPGTPDGMFGPNTRRALMDFQRAHGYPVDGYAGRIMYDQVIATLAAGDLSED